MVGWLRLALGSLLLLAMVVASVGNVSAHSDTDMNANAAAEMEAIPEVTVYPDSLWYGFKLLWEETVDLFITGRAQIERNLTLAERRTEEARVMAIRRSESLAVETALRAQARYDQAIKIFNTIEGRLDLDTRAEVAAEIQTSISKHLSVLERVYLSISENGKRGIETALDSAASGIKRLGEVFDRLEDQEINIRGNLENRIEALIEEKKRDDRMMEEEEETETEHDAEVESETEADGMNANANANVNVNANVNTNINSGLNINN